MNQFELKAIKEILKPHGVNEIYYVAEQFNLNQYAGIHIDLVLKYEYKNEEYFTHCVFEDYMDVYTGNKKNKHEDKINCVINRLKEHKNAVEEMFYSSPQDYTPIDLYGHINEQRDFYYASINEFLKGRETIDRDLMWNELQKGLEKNENTMQLCKRIIKDSNEKKGLLKWLMNLK